MKVTPSAFERPVAPPLEPPLPAHYLSSMTTSSPTGLDSVVAVVKSQAPGRGLPPVHLWHPSHCGEIDIVIRANGQWIHEGSPIGREALVRLFSTVLRLDPDGYHLVTPGEKMRITVEDAPFVAVSVQRTTDERGPVLRFITNVGDEVDADAEHPIRVEIAPETGEPRPYVMVRRGLEALIARPVFYELVDMADERGDEAVLGVESGGARFELGRAESLAT